MNSAGVFVAQLGARRNHAVARAFNDAGRLSRLVTDLCPTMSERVRKSAIPRELIKCNPMFAIRYALARKLAGSTEAMTDIYVRFGKEFSRWSATHLCDQVRVVYGLNTASVELFEAARKKGIPSILEQTIAPFEVEQEWLRESAARNPEYESVISSEALFRLAERERAEWGLATCILSPSSFVTHSLQAVGVDSAKIKQVPYGLAVQGIQPVEHKSGDRLRVLTVGTIGLRKGTPTVLKTADLCRDFADFRLVGPLSPGLNVKLLERPNVYFAGAVTEDQIIQHLIWADVFFLPSVCEGSAQSVSEALAAGRPVITTPNAGTLVTHQKSGFVFGPFEIEKFRGAMHTLWLQPALRGWMGLEARKVAGACTHQNYAHQILDVLQGLL